MKTIHPAGPMSESAIRQLALVHGWDGGGAFNLVAFARALLAMAGERLDKYPLNHPVPPGTQLFQTNWTCGFVAGTEVMRQRIRRMFVVKS